QKQHFPEMSIRLAFDLRNPVQNGPLKIELHEGPNGPGKAGIDRDRKVQGTDPSLLDQLRKRWQRNTVAAVTVFFQIVAFLRRTERALDGWIVVKEREKDRDSFHDRRAKLGVDTHPVVIEPALDRLKLL